MAGSHRLQADLQESEFTSIVSIMNTPEGLLFGAGTTVGNGIEGWAPGAEFIDTDAAVGSRRWENAGSKTTAAWIREGTFAAGSAFTTRAMGGGTSASPLATATADLKFLELRCETTAASGDNRLAYLRYELSGAGGGECLRASTLVNANVGTAHGLHAGIEFLATAGASECSGLGVGIRGTFMIPNVASWAPTGTYAAGMFEIYSEGANSDPAGMTELSVLRLCNSGDTTGAADVDTDAFLFSIQGFTAGNEASGHTWQNTITAATINAACTEALKIKIGSNTRYIPIATAVE